MKFVLVGASLNSGNRGVNALTRGQIYLLMDKYNNSLEITNISYSINKEVINNVMYNGKTIKVKEIPCSNKTLFKTYINAIFCGTNSVLNIIKAADYVLDISEGDSFSDIYGRKRFLQHALMKLIILKAKKILIIMPQTIGPFKRPWVRKVAIKILKKADKVFVRDSVSRKYLKNELKINRDIIMTPDLAFYMEPSSKPTIDNFIDEENVVKFGINVSALLYYGGYTGNNMFGFKADYKKLIDELILKVAKIEGVRVILIPHVMVEEFPVEDDFRVCKNIASEIKQNYNLDITTINKYYREDEIKSVIKGCDFFVGSRMHACIAAISTNVPTVPIAYSRKFIGIWEDIKLGECVTNPIENDNETIISQILELFKKRSEIKSVLLKEIPLVKDRIKDIIDIIEEA